MNQQIAIFETQVLKGTGKSGVLKPDSTGYFELIMGAFDIRNAAGEFYPFTKELENMFSDGGSLTQRINNGYLKGEIEHPRPEPGMSLMAFLGRLKSIRNNLVSHHIRRLRLEWQTDDKGKKIVVVYGEVRPTGNCGPGLLSTLSNPEENAAFSLRSLTIPVVVGYEKHKHVTLIVTYDAVNEPGITKANKYEAPGLESSEQIWMPDTEIYTGEGISITPDVLNMAEASATNDLVGLENDDISFAMIRTHLNWQKVEVVNAGARLRNIDW